MVSYMTLRVILNDTAFHHFNKINFKYIQNLFHFLVSLLFFFIEEYLYRANYLPVSQYYVFITLFYAALHKGIKLSIPLLPNTKP